MTDYGAEIAVDGVRPRFVRDGDEFQWVTEAPAAGHFCLLNSKPEHMVTWRNVTAIRLKSDHPQYLVMQHPGMVMHTMDARPVDFDAGKPVLFRSGYCGTASPENWHGGSYGEGTIIGYHPLPSPPVGGTFSCPICGKDTPHHHALPASPSVEVESDWAMTRAELECAGYDSDIDAFARYIRTHETPPVDEATELWERAFATWDSDDGGTSELPSAILRDHLAKVRGETA